MIIQETLVGILDFCSFFYSFRILLVAPAGFLQFLRHNVNVGLSMDEVPRREKKGTSTRLPVMLDEFIRRERRVW